MLRKTVDGRISACKVESGSSGESKEGVGATQNSTNHKRKSVNIKEFETAQQLRSISLSLIKTQQLSAVIWFHTAYFYIFMLKTTSHVQRIVRRSCKSKPFTSFPALNSDDEPYQSI